MDQRRVRLERGFGGGHRGLGIVLDLDEIGRVACRCWRLGDDSDDRHADRRHATPRQRRIWWDLYERERNGWNVADILEIVARDHRDHARMGTRGLYVNAHQACAGIR